MDTTHAVFTYFSKACALPPTSRGGSVKVSGSLLRTISRRLDQSDAGFTVTAAASKPLKNPKGGLTPAGRKAFGGNLKPGVKNYSSASLADKKRWISWARRFYGRKVYPPLVDEKGNPTRFALTAWAWGEPVPKTEEAARKIAAKAEVRAAALKMGDRT